MPATRPRPSNVVAACWKQWRAERALARRGVRFRSTDLDTVTAAYAAMTAAEFEAVNGRQEWANWQTVPRALRGRLPDRAWNVLDLGCGTGTSTRVLAHHAPPGSDILAYELVPALAAQAARRRYPDAAGGDARVRFACQSLTEAWCDAAGRRLPDGWADLAHSSGVLGHHLDAAAAEPVVAELRRVVRPGGLAVLDDGPTLPPAALAALLRAAGFRPLGRVRSWPFARSGQVAFRRGA